MKIVVVTPTGVPRGGADVFTGNRITALRYAGFLRDLGHDVRVEPTWGGEACDLLVALHATKSADSIRSFRERVPRAPLVVVLTGTDVYGDLAGDADRARAAAARASLALATRVVVLQAEALRELDPEVRARTRVILQSARRFDGSIERDPAVFQVCAVGHLRAVKDPLLAARAAGMLPASSRIRIVHAGAALEPDLGRLAREESRSNPRWSWIGDCPHAQVLELLARSHVFVQTSLAEGGSSAMSEAIVAELPILCTRIPGALGMLGADRAAEHEGYFAVGDARALADLLSRCESDERFRSALAATSARLAPLFTPEREREAWRALLAEMSSG